MEKIIDRHWFRTDEYEIVTEWPRGGYIVWAIGRENFPHTGFLPLAQIGQALQTKILQDHALCSLDVSVSFCSNLLGFYPRAELYSCSFCLNFNGTTDSCSVTDEDEYEDAVDWLNKVEKTIDNL